AKAESQRVETRHIEANDLRPGVVVGAGAYRGAQAAEAEKRKQRSGDSDRGKPGEGLCCVDDQRADLEAVESVGRLDAARVRAEHDQQAVGENDRDGNE